MAKGAVQGHYDEWNNHNGENRVACQDREINRTGQACALKTRRAVIIVIGEIRSEKE